jgi:hypothetical protein
MALKKYKKALRTARDLLVAYDHYLVLHGQVAVPCSIVHSKITPTIHVLSEALNYTLGAKDII